MTDTSKKASMLKIAGAAAVLALAPVMMITPASAFGHGGGGGRGGGGMGGMHASGFGGGARPSFSGGSARNSFAAVQPGARTAGVNAMRTANVNGGQWNHGGRWHGRGWRYGAGLVAGAAIGAPYGYYYDDGSYDDAYYDNGDYQVGYGGVYSGTPALAAGAAPDAASCAQIYRSYDPASGTYLGYDGLRHPCP